MKYLNGIVKWSHSMNVIKIESRFDKYKKVTNILDLYNTNDSLIYLHNRIGSVSHNGEVFKARTKDQDFVVKILPIINEFSKKRNKNEIAISELASQSVLRKLSIHFPIIYGYDECEMTDFYNRKMTYKSRMYQKGSSKSHVLFQELCICDLNQYFELNKNITRDELLYIKKQCYMAISDMHQILGVCHNNLILDNFLLLPDNNSKYGYIILISDFGMAEFRSTNIDLDYDIFELNF